MNNTYHAGKCLNGNDWRYIEVTVLICCFVIGAPVNAHVYQLLRDPNFPKLNGLSDCFKKLQKALNLSDLMVVFIYVPSQLFQLVMVWRAGDIVCRLVHFGEIFSFHLSSNVVAAIAIVRLLKPKTRQNKIFGSLMIVVCWVLAFLCSFPIVFLWEVDDSDISLPKCQSITADGKVTQFELSFILFYGYFHLSTMCWVPIIIIVVCYLTLIFRMYLPFIFNDRPDADNLTSLTARKLSIRQKRSTIAQSVRFSEAVSVRALQSLTNSHEPSIHLEPLPSMETYCTDTDSINAESMRSIRTKRASCTSEGTESVRSVPSSIRGNLSDLKMGKAVRITLGLVVFYILCWFPYNIGTVMLTLNVREAICPILVSRQLMVLNSVLNPFFYAIKTDLKSIQSCIRAMPTSRF